MTAFNLFCNKQIAVSDKYREGYERAYHPRVCATCLWFDGPTDDLTRIEPAQCSSDKAYPPKQILPDDGNVPACRHWQYFDAVDFAKYLSDELKKEVEPHHADK